MKRWRLVHKKTGQLCVHPEVSADSAVEAVRKFMKLIGKLPKGTMVICLRQSSDLVAQE